MAKEVEGDFVSQRVSYMIQAIRGALPNFKDTLKNLEKCSTNADKFSFVWKMKDVHEVLALEKEFEEKSAELAKKHREKGNEYFQKKSYLSALGEYNLSVLKAPTTMKEEDKTVEDYIKNGKLDTNSDELNMKKESETNDQPLEEGQVDSVSGDQDHESKPGGKEITNSSTVEKPKNEISLAFANRSAALFHLKKYRECLEDIRFALENGYPENLHYKMFDRQGSCYLELGNQVEGISSFMHATRCLSFSNLDEKSTNIWTKTFDKQLGRCKQLESNSEPESLQSTKMSLPRLTGEPNVEYPNASKIVRIQYNNVVGRHVTAMQDIKVGDILMVDKPFASVLFSNFYKTHCYHCFVRVYVPVPCVQCSSVIYCSRDCCEASWAKFHSYECVYFALLDTSVCAKIGQLAIRLIMVLGLNPILEFLKQREGRPNDISSIEQVGKNSDGIYSSEYESIYDMVSNSAKRKPDEIFDFCVVSCLLMKILQLSHYVEISEESQDFLLLGGVLLHHLQIIQCNAHRVVELQQPERFDETKSADLGIGLYPTTAIINHSCDPNADLNFYNETVTVRAIRNIYEGEEIAISYGPLFYDVKAGRRQMQLKGVYCFNCRCPACKEEWPIIEEMFDESVKYRCENCRADLTTEDKFERKYFKCRKCEHKQDMEDVVGKLQTSYDMFARSMNDAMSGHSQEALPNFIQHLLLLQCYIRQPWRDFCACQTAVKISYRLMANTKQ